MTPNDDQASKARLTAPADHGTRSRVALPTPCMPAEMAFELLGVDRTTGYRAIRKGAFPIPVIRVGRVIRVPTAALVRLLELEPGAQPVSEPGPEPEPMETPAATISTPPTPSARRRRTAAARAQRPLDSELTFDQLQLDAS